MARPSYPASILQFQRRFADESACLEYLARSRWPEGFVCPGCGGERAWVLERRHLWECAACRLQTSVTAGTVMHGTRTPLTLWFWAAYLVATHNPGISALQLQRQLAIGRYETAWLILQKLRRAMVAPEREPLKHEVEVDETFVGGRNPQRRGGRDRVGKTLVGVAVEVRGRASGRVRLSVLEDASAYSLHLFLNDAVAAGAIVHSDGWRGYSGLAEAGWDHRPITQHWREVDARQEILPRAHRAVANLKTWLAGTHHGTSAKHLQVYLDEFVFRHNRRRVPMAAFQTLLGLGSLHSPTTYRQITDAATA
ncbi:MAG TPA: IS1595 family transposase [Solirubrobacteraceae bacterium]